MSRTSTFKKINDLDKSYKFIVKKNILLILLFMAFFIGMIYGSIILSESIVLKGSTKSIVDSFISARTSQTILQTFISSICSAGIVIIVLYFLGFCAISHPIIFFLIFFKGLGIGITISYMYSTYNIKGIIFSLSIIVFPTIISTITLILSARESLRLSNLFLSRIFPKIQGELCSKTFKLYNLKYIVLSFLIFISSILDVLCSFIFSGLFDL